MLSNSVDNKLFFEVNTSVKLVVDEYSNNASVNYTGFSKASNWCFLDSCFSFALLYEYKALKVSPPAPNHVAL